MNDHLKSAMQFPLRHEGSASYADLMPRAAQILCVALIDDLKLSRECFISAAFITQPLLAMTPFSSIKEFLKGEPRDVDLVVYVHHDHDMRPLDELASVLQYVPAQNVVIISESSAEDALPQLQEFEARSVSIIHAQDTALQTVISMLYVIRHGRHSASPHHGWRAAAEPARQAQHPQDIAELTKRERTVLDLVRQGQTNKEIAQALQTSISTVKAHVRNIMQKTGFTNRIQLALGMHRPAGSRPGGPSR